MSRDDVATQIITPMMLLYQSPHALSAAQQTVVLESYIMALKQFDAAILGETWTSVVAAHRGRLWPVPGVIASHAHQIAKTKRDDVRRAQPPISIAEEREKHWQHAMRTPVARAAVDKGVAWSFKIAICDENKSVAEFNLAGQVEAKARNARLVDRIRDNQPLTSLDGRNIGTMHGAARLQALSWYDTMQIAEAKVAAEIVAAANKGSA